MGCLSGRTGCEQNPCAERRSFHNPFFDKDEEISAHSACGDAFVACLDGTGGITIDGEPYELHEGESIVMPAGHPHAVYGRERFKMLFVVVK